MRDAQAAARPRAEENEEFDDRERYENEVEETKEEATLKLRQKLVPGVEKVRLDPEKILLQVYVPMNPVVISTYFLTRRQSLGL